MKDTKTGPKSRLFRNHGHRAYAIELKKKLEVALFRNDEISTMNSIAKTLIWTGATTRATR